MPSPFEVFGLAPAFALDERELKRRLLRFSRMLHPDYFAGADATTRERAERNTAALNEAYEVLVDPARRADWLVRSLGGPGESDQREMPKAFLLEVLEWNETLEAARSAPAGSRERAAVAELATTLRDERERVLRTLASSLDPLPPRGSPKLVEARSQLNALRYLETTLEQIAALEVDQAASTRS